MKVLILIILASFGCNTNKATTKSKSTIGDGDITEVRKMTVKRSYKKSDERLAFKIKDIKQLDNTISIDLQYSGCGAEHDFELISTGKVGSDGVVDLYLVDNTKGDMCKMMIMKTKHFDISKFNRKAKVTGFRLNDSKVISFKRTK